MDQFVQWATANPVAHIEAAWQAWSARQSELDEARGVMMAQAERIEHLEQQLYEEQQRRTRLRLVHSTAA